MLRLQIITCRYVWININYLNFTRLTPQNWCDRQEVEILCCVFWKWRRYFQLSKKDKDTIWNKLQLVTVDKSKAVVFTCVYCNLWNVFPSQQLIVYQLSSQQSDSYFESGVKFEKWVKSAGCSAHRKFFSQSACTVPHHKSVCFIEQICRVIAPLFPGNWIMNIFMVMFKHIVIMRVGPGPGYILKKYQLFNIWPKQDLIHQPFGLFVKVCLTIYHLSTNLMQSESSSIYCSLL